MSPSLRRLAPALLLGVLLVPSWAGAVPAPRIDIAPGPPPFTLEAPAHGAVLTAGSLAELAWTPLPGPADHAPETPETDEWEAFLSVDGGATYPFRVTPHLDADLRRVLWEVPHLPTRDARLLLRLGDERRETAYALPGRFVIVGDPSSARIAESAAAVSFHRGEPALPGGPGVISWVDGTRRGAAARQTRAVEPLGLRKGVSPLWERHREAGLGAEEDGGHHPPAQSGALQNRQLRRPSPGATGALTPAARHSPSDLLLLLRRRNE